MSRWYIIHACSGFGNKVRNSIMVETTRLGLERLVGSVWVPIEKVTEVRCGKEITSDKKFFPGYALAKLAVNDDVYDLVNNTSKLTDFLGSMGKPQPISELEAAHILNTEDKAATAAPKTKTSGDHEIGDSMKVLDGPVRELQRLVEALDFDRSRVRCRSRSSAARRRWSWSSSR